MPTIEQLVEAVRAAVSGAVIEIIPSTPAAAQPALLVDCEHAVAVARYLKDDPTCRMDFCSCVTGVDYLAKGYIEAVYHLYSVTLKQGPIVLKVRAPRELDKCHVPSLTPVWRGCEFQEREAFDLYGIKFDDHPDLRRILMWNEFTDHPMRKDYVPPADYEWEPTPHDDVLKHTKADGGIMPPSAAVVEVKK
ncbi:MAG: NADH-quinone oxidoreductase subunit C [Verrucomicrobiota bacterium]